MFKVKQQAGFREPGEKPWSLAEALLFGALGTTFPTEKCKTEQIQVKMRTGRVINR